MKFTKKKEVTALKQKQPPAKHPSTTTKECSKKEVRDEAPTESSLMSDRCLCEPDVVVVVSGVEFRHYGPVLSLGSEFFDELLNSGTEPTQLKRVTFPDKDPEEWKQVAKFFEPLYSPNAGKLTKDNIYMLLPWFDLLRMKHLKKNAEALLIRKTLPPPGTDHILLSRVRSGHKDRMPLGSGDTEAIKFWKSELEELCNTFLTSLRYQFADLKKNVGGILKTVMIESPDFFTFDSVNTLLSALAWPTIDKKTKEQIWQSFKFYIPPTIVSSNDINLVMANPLLPHLILRGMESSTVGARKERRGALSRLRASRGAVIVD